jgi:hypothetical protein
MIRQGSLVLVIMVVMAISACSGIKDDSDAQVRPNILFIMSDDHAYQAISAYDNRLINTPNIDRLANEGMLFTNACITNSICAPSRATILTGKHTHINGNNPKGVDDFMILPGQGDYINLRFNRPGETQQSPDTRPMLLPT